MVHLAITPPLTSLYLGTGNFQKPPIISINQIIMNQMCPQHGQAFQSLCIDEKCQLQPFSCMECYKTHQCPKLEILQGIEEFALKLSLDLTPFDKIANQFKQLEVEAFASSIKAQKLKLQEDIAFLRQEVLKKFDALEHALLDAYEEQIQVYKKNLGLFKNLLKETEKFKSLNKPVDMLKLKLSNQDPNQVMKKLKAELLNYQNHIDCGKLGLLKEYLIVLQSQSAYPPTYRSKDFRQQHCQRLLHQFDDFLRTAETAIQALTKSFPIKDLESRAHPAKKLAKQTKIQEEENCITAFLILQDLVVYSLNDMNVKLKRLDFSDVEQIQCDTQINCIIQIERNFQLQETIIQGIGRQVVDEKDLTVALGGDEFILIWGLSNSKLIQMGQLSHDRLSRCLCLAQKDTSLIAGDWEGQIFVWNLSDFTQAFVVETNSTILFSLQLSSKYLISGSKCDMEMGGVIFWSVSQKDCNLEKRVPISQVQRMHVAKERLYVVDSKCNLHMYDCEQILLLRVFQCSESYVCEISVDEEQNIYILNQTCLKMLSDKSESITQYEDFPCSTCRQLYQSKRIHSAGGTIGFIRHVHQCKHESGNDDKCQMKSTFYIIRH